MVPAAEVVHGYCREHVQAAKPRQQRRDFAFQFMMQKCVTSVVLERLLSHARLRTADMFRRVQKLK